jgi:hypothetical protein
MPTYPNFAPGQLATAERLGAIPEEYIIKPATQSRTNNSADLIDDDHFWFPLALNATYEWELLLRVAGNSGGDIRVSWTIPLEASMFRLCFGPAAGLSSQDNSNGVYAYRSFHTQQIYGVPTSGNCAIYERGTVTNGNNHGSLQLRWTQGTAHSTLTELGADSCLKYRRIA